MTGRGWDDLGGFWSPALTAIEQSVQGKEITERMVALEYAFGQYKEETEVWMFNIPLRRGFVDHLVATFAHYDEEECPECAEELDDFLRWIVSGFASIMLQARHTGDSDEEEPEEG